MPKARSLFFVAAALFAGGATTAVCFGDALSMAAEPTFSLSGTAFTPAPAGATTRPINVFDHAQPWLISPPGGPTALRGKVVLVNFWTYSCINSLRALPYLRAWQQRYGDKGLVVVGVHAPEFQFEHDPSKVRLALTQLKISYPNVQDNGFDVWRQYANEGWPGFYFIDAKGQVRGYRVGEERYEDSERLIRKLLTEAGHDVSSVPLAPVSASGIEAQADWANLGSPEAYLGYAKATGFQSPGGLRPETAHHYSAATILRLNNWDLAGQWTVGREFATVGVAPGVLRYRFHARDAHLVLGGAPDGKPVRFRVTIDGAAPGRNHGVDTDAAGWGVVKEDRLYQLIRQSGSIGDHTLTIEFERPSVRAYVFTFG